MIFYTADLHFGHTNVLQYCNRPWDDVESMNEGLINNWNEVVSPTDSVVVLGDVALGRFADSIRLVLRLNGKKYLVPGNHDRCWTGHKKVRTKEYEEVGFEIWDNQESVALGEYPDVLHVPVCHFPYEGDSHDSDRYSKFRPINYGEWLLHGHVHDSWKVKDRQINVGVDVNSYKPISEVEILRIINGNV